ncbi:sensor histidine kinase [Salinarimonas soli]|uniref:histidine kinase n=1 Tax=Salinarimonas soli TaxID=1638099 RepID=A0A5B2VBY9_9HYPH|nr:HWE histidine kinase domain-containing protein [Salinarimonas soli]KAA2236484.1 GAF domain-containing protein [Salinarimonas soli]
MTGDQNFPWDEEQRLATLRAYAILDTPPEPDFDDIAHLAAHICGTPVSAISLVEDRRQWFKAEVGLGLRETPIEVSFCAKAALRPGLTIVPDAAADPRFSRNPLVAEHPHLRFYAGARLDSPAGLPLGTLCVLDYVPRDLSPDQRNALSALARQVVAQLELRHAIAARDEALAASRRAEERQALLVRELHHRTRNQLAVMQSLLGATARASHSTAEFYSAFSGRITSMARTQALLTEDYWQTASLRELLLNELRAHADEESGRIALSGPDLHLAADLAVPLSMALHELAINAARHGALSAPGGQVEVAWDERRDGLHRSLCLDWREHGGGPVEKPARRGVGSQIQRMLELQCNARVEITYAPDGLRFSVTAPLIEQRLVPAY